MKLQRLIVQDFRGLKGDGNIIDFSGSDIIFLIGQNNVGKSTYLRAYEFFVNPSQSAQREDFYNYDSAKPIVMEGWFVVEEPDADDKDLQKDGKSLDPNWIQKWAGDNKMIRVRKMWTGIGKFSKETFSPQESKWVANGFGGMDSLFAKYAPTPLFINAMEDENSLEEKVNKLIQDNFIKKVREQHKDLCDEIIKKIKKLQEAITSSDDVKEFDKNLNRHFQETFSDLKLTIEASGEENIKLEDAFKKNHTISVTSDRSGREESFLQNGHGVIRQALFNFIAFLRENTSTRKEYMILFEEPELFLHPKVAYKLRESLYALAENSPYQVLCATHSPLMIDISKRHSSLIRVVKDVNENTCTYQVGEKVFGGSEERKQQVQMINRFNPHVCEAFYADEVILVEGDTEAIIYRELLSHYYPNRDIFVLNTGSKNNIPFFQEILTHFRIKHVVIHDVDTEFNKKGKKNSAWALNESIWNSVVKANEVAQGLSRRYVHNANFENAHKYKLIGGKDKPLLAFVFAQKIIKDSLEDADCLKWLRDALGDAVILHDDKYVEENKKTLDRIAEDEKTYVNLMGDDHGECMS